MRLVWDNWVKDDGNRPIRATARIMSRLRSSLLQVVMASSLYDYFGLPTKVAGFSHSALRLGRTP